MSELRADTITSATDNTDLEIQARGTGVPNLSGDTKLNGVALTTAFLSPTGDGSGLSGVGGGGYIQTQYFTGSGTYTPHADTTKLKVTVVGGGGGGGGTGSSTGYIHSASGGGGGGTAIEDFAIGDITSTVAVTVGTGGAAGSSSGGNGGTGGTSSFGAYCSATGGGAGLGISGDSYLKREGGAGGSGSGGDLNLSGQQGQDNFDNNGLNGSYVLRIGGDGGNSIFPGGGRGGCGRGAVNDSGTAGEMPGCGGGGAEGYNPSQQAGSAGAAGIIIIEEYA